MVCSVRSGVPQALGLHVVIAWLILTLGAALIEFLAGRSWKRLGIVTFITAIASGVVLTEISWSEQQQTKPKPEKKEDVFLIHQKGSVSFGDYPMPFLYEYGTDDSLAPIGLALNVEVINNRPSKTKVAQYVADISTTDGSWHRILSLPMSPPHVIYFLNLRDITRGMKCKFDPAIFDVVADNRTLDLGEPLEGVMFFEWPSELRAKTVMFNKLKLTVKNAQGETAEATFGGDTPQVEVGASSFDDGLTFCRGVPGQRIDLSSRTIRPFRD